MLKSEILAAITEIKAGKAVGVDEIPTEMWKRMRDKTLIEMCELCQKMYEEGKWPDDFTKVVMIPLLKKNNTTDCSDFRLQ